MGIVDIPYIETVVGFSIDSEDEPRIQRYINIVSAYVRRVTGRTFELIEGDVIKAIADGSGIIEIPDLQAVSKVELRDAWNNTYSDVMTGIPYAFNSGQFDDWCSSGWFSGFGFDGISMVYGLKPRASYRLTVDHGEEAPDDIKGVVGDLVTAGTGLDTSSRSGLASKRVGDVEEFYGVSYDGNVTLTSLMSKVLDDHSVGNTTYRT